MFEPIMIRSHRTFLLTLLMPLQLLAVDTLNVAAYGKPIIHYKGTLPSSINPLVPDSNKMNPAALIDQDYTTFVEFPVGPASNIGSWFGVVLPEPKVITTITIHQIFNSSTAYRLRVRKASVWGSTDSVQWTLLSTVTNVDTTRPTLVIPIVPSIPTRLIRVELLALDVVQPTVVSELRVFIPNDSNYHRIVGVSASPQTFQNGGSSTLITWNTENHPPGSKVNISLKAPGDKQFRMIAENELNDGSFSLNTTLLLEGSGSIRIEPVGSGYNLGKQTTFTVNNYGLPSVSVSGNYNGQFPAMSSSYSRDSIELTWTFNPKIKSDYRFRMIVSSDSGRTWTLGSMLQDSSRRKLKWGIPSEQPFGLYCFLGIDILVDSMIISRVVYPYPQIIVGKMPFSVSWTKVSNPWSNTPRTSIATVRLNNGVEPAVILGPDWVLQPSGAPLPSFMPQFVYSGMTAVADMNGNGSFEIAARLIRSENGSVLFYDTLEVYGSDPQIADFNGDGSPEIITTIGNSICIRSNTGGLLRKIAIPNPSYGSLYSPIIVNIDGTPEPEIITGITGQNQFFIFRSSGVTVPNSPVTLSDILQSPPMVADLDKDDKLEIIILGQNTLWCFDPSGNVKSGFPISISDIVNRQNLSIADINNDSYLDIIFSSSRTPSGTGLTETTIHCIDRFGKTLDGWPTTITDGYRHYRLDQFSPETVPTIFNGVFSPPYIVSMDGDKYNEVVFLSTNGYMYVFDHMGKLNSSLSTFIGPTVSSAPDFSDIDGDGRLNAYVSVVSHGMLNTLALDFAPGSYNPSRMPWPTYRQNIARTAIPPQPIPLGVDNDQPSVVRSFMLEQNYPNPFNPSTTITFSVPVSGPALLTLHDVLGREVRRIVDEQLVPGQYSRTFTEDGLNSGVYFYTLTIGQHTDTKRMTLIK